MKKVFITTAIDYTNDVVHIGHAYQKIVADCLARYYRREAGSSMRDRTSLGDKNVFFLTGTDEHGGNIEQAAKKIGKEPKIFVDEITEQDKKQWHGLHISYDRFIRTTDEDHKKIVGELWKKSFDAGDIYKDKFHGLYCLGCESYKTASEIVGGKCILHKTKELQQIEEENYFFRWSKYQKKMEALLQNVSFIYPSQRLHEMQSFLAFPGLSDIPISRQKKKISWGIPVPDDSSQVIYVWFDALINYYTAASQKGFWDDETEIIHIIGKDNLRWHALLWPAMLQSVGARLPNKIYAHGFINLNGQKISKSLGNVIHPDELVKQFGADAVRYFFLKYGPAIDDVDISIEKIKSVYNSELANGLGNTISRVAKLCEKSGCSFEKENILSIVPQIGERIKEFRFHDALEIIWGVIETIDKSFDEKQPWTLNGGVLSQFLETQVACIHQIATDLAPFMPETSEKILKQFSKSTIKAEKPYFPRLDD